LKNFSLTYFLLFISITVFSQSSNYWKTLSDVEIKIKPDKTQKYEVEYPEFGEKVKAIDNTEIHLSGYIVPLKELTGHKYFVLSAYPFNMCFFCGAAGPETVIEVYSKEEIDFTSDKITIKGKLKLNYDDPDHLMYMLNDAYLIE